MNSGKDKKLTVYTKNIQGKKPNLEIQTNPDHDNGVKPNLNPTSLPTNEQGSNKIISSLASPVHNKNGINNHNQGAEQAQQPTQKKQPMQKKISQKDQPVGVNKIQINAKTTAPNPMNGFVSPKAAINKDKVLISYTSQKNLGLGMKQEKKEIVAQRDSKNKIQQLQKIIEQSKIKQLQLNNKQSQLEEQITKLRVQNKQLIAQNIELKKKIQKFKTANEQTRKMLKQKTHAFNQQSGQMQELKNQIKTLEERVQSLLQQNQTLKAQINKFSDFNLKDLSNLQALNGSNAFTISNVRQVQLQESRVSQLYLKQSGERDLLQFTNMENMQQNLDLESYITQQQESYIQQYKTNVDKFDKIKNEYEHIVKDIQIRYKVMVQEYDKSAKQQAAEIFELQNKIDDLLDDNKQSQKDKIQLSLSLDELLLKKQNQIASLNLKIFDLRDANKQLLQDIEHHRNQCRFLEAELDIERMKKKFKNENDKFEYNVVKLNLLNIIDKLKMQIDKQKSKYNKINQKYRSERIRPKEIK